MTSTVPVMEQGMSPDDASRTSTVNSPRGKLRIGLAIQGGGMRSAYAMGAVATLARNELASSVSSIVATSGGALSAAYYISGIAEEGVEDFTGVLCSRKFISYGRPWKIVDLDYLVDDWIRNHRIPDLRAVAISGPRVLAGVCRWPTGAIEYIPLERSDVDPYMILKASCAIPIYYGRRVKVGPHSYVDGGIGDPLPLLRAGLEDVDLVVAISTRAPTDLRLPEKGAAAAIVRLWPRVGRGVRSLILDSNPLIDVTTAAMLADGTKASRPYFVVSPSDSARLVSRVTNERKAVADCVAMGRADMERSLLDIGHALDAGGWSTSSCGVNATEDARAG